MLRKDMLSLAARRLSEKGVDDGGYEARELMGLAMGADCRGPEFLEHLKEEPAVGEEKRFNELLEERLRGRPLQYILGEWEFYGIRIKVGEGVLIPRQDTEMMVEICESRLKGRRDLRVIDLCAGSGCIALAMEKRLSCQKIAAVEKSPKALSFLRENISLHGSSVDPVEGDVLDPGTVGRLFDADLILCNPPYLTSMDMEHLQTEVGFEPEEALFGGEDGLDFYRGITRLWKERLLPGGMMLYEIGKGQEDDVMAVMIQHGLQNVRCLKDHNGIYRNVIGVKPE
ncbi:MAG: peptide chain release factor N(5)-glutamine methyltransferase [Ruminococcus sp.]|nr:peptide chain release factor N(5)-glutamine methyltransferase [Ruminococcus sp.]